MTKPALPRYDPIPSISRIRVHLESCLESVVALADCDVRAGAAGLIAADAEVAVSLAKSGVLDLIRNLASQRAVEKRRILDLRSNTKAKARRDVAKLQNTAETVPTEDTPPP